MGVDFRIVDNFVNQFLCNPVSLESLCLLSEHVSRILVEQEHCSKSSVPVKRPTCVLLSQVVFIVCLEKLDHLLVLCLVSEEVLLKHGLTGWQVAILVLLKVIVDDCVDAEALLLGDWLRWPASCQFGILRHASGLLDGVQPIRCCLSRTSIPLL